MITKLKTAAFCLTIGLLTTAGLIGSNLASAKIYKIVDEDGNVSYTDIAPTEQQKESTTAVEMQLVNTFSDPVVNNTPDAAEPITEAPSYESLEVVAPANSTSIRSNNGSVTLAVEVQPALQSGHRIRFFLNGKPVGTVNGTNLALQNIDRGTHTVAAVILNQQGQPVRDSSTTQFTLQRASVTPKVSRPPAAS